MSKEIYCSNCEKIYNNFLIIHNDEGAELEDKYCRVCKKRIEYVNLDRDSEKYLIDNYGIQYTVDHLGYELKYVECPKEILFKLIL